MRVCPYKTQQNKCTEISATSKYAIDADIDESLGIP